MQIDDSFGYAARKLHKKASYLAQFDIEIGSYQPELGEVKLRLIVELMYQ